MDVRKKINSNYERKARVEAIELLSQVVRDNHKMIMDKLDIVTLDIREVRDNCKNQCSMTNKHGENNGGPDSSSTSTVISKETRADVADVRFMLGILKLWRMLPFLVRIAIGLCGSVGASVGIAYGLILFFHH
jgi:hypothetical protein